MKNQKFKLDELKVQSFVTDFDQEQGQTQDIQGGSHLVFCLGPSVLVPCTINTTITRPTLCNNSCFAATCNYALCPDTFTWNGLTDLSGPPVTFGKEPPKLNG